MVKSKTIMIVAGEASGDLHAGALARELLCSDPSLKLVGVGGTEMKKAGVELLADISSLNVMGLTEIGGKFKSVISVFFDLLKEMRKTRPALLILVDFPDFNLLLARFAKRYGVPVMYYISPQVWAWRRGRTRTIAKLVDKMVVILPFEVDFYKQYGVEVEFVGHPLLDALQDVPGKDKAREQLGIDSDAKVVGILPGSRLSEVKKLLGIMLDAIGEIKETLHDVQFLFPLANTLSENDLSFVSREKLEMVKVHKGKTSLVMSACDLLIAASGTVTLEAAIIGTPLIIIYRLSNLSYYLGKCLIRVPYIGLVNLVAGECLAPELVQDDANPGNIAKEAVAILTDKERQLYIKNRFSDVRNSLGKPGASSRAARVVMELIGN
ncbi:MAG TPA: lipid-A-disaccharide synthase [Deltaproteobacteria bacterium]|nr:lipid-A-disaccharide synthase [Deltaproteobacteria bacterium]